IYNKFKFKKDFFENKIQRWKEKNNKKFYEHGSSLLEELKKLAQIINEEFVSTAENQPDKKELNYKIKQFKKLYKQLNEITKPVWRQWIEAIVVAGTLVFVLRTFIFGLYHVPTGSAEPTILVGDRIWGNKMIYYFNKVKRGDCVIFDSPEFIYDKSSSINHLWQKYIGLPIPVLGLSDGPVNWVKRVIAVPGDTIEGKIENGKTAIYLNGKKLDESAYVNPYPLIGLAKKSGIIDLPDFGPISFPSFLKKNIRSVYYTYDPEKSFEEQPFYNMKENEVIRRYDGSPLFRKPHFPTYEFSSTTGEFGSSIDSFGPIKLPEGKYWVMGDSRKNSKDSRYWEFLDEDLIHGRASFIIYSIDSEQPLWLFELLNHPIDFWIKSIRWNRFIKNIK
ncbi:signal peptidase I, partial [Candidatus Dependentiae bacterium]